MLETKERKALYVAETVEQGATQGVGKMTCIQLLTFRRGPIPELGLALQTVKTASSGLLFAKIINSGLIHDFAIFSSL